MDEQREQTTTAKPTPTKKPTVYLDTLLYLAIVACLFAVPLAERYYWYRDGLAFSLDTFSRFDAWFLLNGLAWLLFVVLAVRLLVLTVLLIARIRRLVPMRFLLRVLLALIAITFLVAPHPDNPPGTVTAAQARVLKARVQRDIDIAAIQAWLADHPDLPVEHRPELPDASRLPGFELMNLPLAVLERPQGYLQLRLDYGDSYDHWGLVVGPAEMEVREEEFFVPSRLESQHRFPVAPGAYVYIAHGD